MPRSCCRATEALRFAALRKIVSNAAGFLVFYSSRRLLKGLILYAQTACQASIHPLITNLATAMTDDNDDVNFLNFNSCFALCTFLPPSAWLPSILDMLH